MMATRGKKGKRMHQHEPKRRPGEDHRVVKVEGGYIIHPDDRPDHREWRRQINRERREAEHRDRVKP